MAEITFYDLTKDIIIPILSPILTALTLILFVWQEKKKADLESKSNIKQGAQSILQDLLFFREAYQLFGLKVLHNEPITNERIQQLRETFGEIQRRLTHNPDLFKEYLSTRNSNKNNLTLLLIELQVTINSVNQTSKTDNFILFGVYNLLYIFSKDQAQINDTKNIREQIRQTNPKLFDPFIALRKDE